MTGPNRGQKNSIIPVFIPHLGCPQDCVFCNQRTIASPTVPSSEDIYRLIEGALPKARGIPQVAFYGGSFTAIDADLQEAYLAAADSFVKEGRISGIRISTRPDFIDEEILSRLKGYPVATIELGAQSMDDEVLRRSCRGHTAADTVRASKLIKQSGIELILQIMAGLPGEDAQTPMKNAVELADLKPDGVRIYPVVVVEGTALASMWRAGIYVPLTTDEAVLACAEMMALFDTRGISVIRAGLNPTEDLKAGVLAGPYHPAFGELCMSRIAYGKVRGLLAGVEIKKDANLVLAVAGGMTSIFTGQRGSNLALIKEEYGLKTVKIVEDSSKDGKDNFTGKIKDRYYVEISSLY